MYTDVLRDLFPNKAAPFIWNDSVKKTLEEHRTKAMRLNELPEVIHVEFTNNERNGSASTMHYLAVRFAGDRVSEAR